MTQKHDPWNPPAEVLKDCNAEVDEVFRFVSLPPVDTIASAHFMSRVLKAGGTFVYLTWAQPRKPTFGWGQYRTETLLQTSDARYYLDQAGLYPSLN